MKVKDKPHAMEGMTIAEAGQLALNSNFSLWVYEGFRDVRGKQRKRVIKKFEGLDWRMEATASGGIIVKVDKP